jgi:hypothetical protein
MIDLFEKKYFSEKGGGFNKNGGNSPRLVQNPKYLQPDASGDNSWTDQRGVLTVSPK